MFWRVIAGLGALTFLLAGGEVAIDSACDVVVVGGRARSVEYECLTRIEFDQLRKHDVELGATLERPVAAVLAIVVGVGLLSIATWPLPRALLAPWATDESSSRPGTHSASGAFKKKMLCPDCSELVDADHLSTHRERHHRAVSPPPQRDHERGEQPGLPSSHPSAEQASAVPDASPLVSQPDHSERSSDLETLSQLADLHERGLLSEDEFSAAKRRLLG